jgi:hypothetical protein
MSGWPWDVGECVGVLDWTLVRIILKILIDALCPQGVGVTC